MKLAAQAQTRAQPHVPLDPPAPPRTLAEAIKACAGTVNPYVFAHKAATKAAITLDADAPFVIAFKSTSDERMEITGVVSRAGVLDRQGETINPGALRAAAYALAQNLGAVRIDRNHEKSTSATLLQSWMGDGIVGDQNSLYVTIGCAACPEVFRAAKSGTLVGLSWSGPIEYAAR